MQTCPHCRAELRENARFCPICMTALNQKRVVPTPKHFPLRWLSLATAVLVFVAAVWGVEQGLYTDPPPVTDTIGTVSTTLTTAASTTLTTVASTTLTTAVESLSAASTTVTTVAYTNFLPVYPSTADTEVTSGRVPSFLTTAGTTTPTSTTRSTTKAPTTTTKAPTTTTTTTTTTTAATPTYPASWDEPAVFYTEDGQVFEDVGWTYEAASDLLILNRGDGSYHSYSFTKTRLHDIPLSECIVVTGFKKIASNGCYRIPPVIDGKVVIAVNMQNPSEAYRFNDAMVAPTVRVITFPPEMIVVYPYTFDQCQNIEHAYFTSAELLMYPSAVPTNTGANYSDSLAMHAYRTRMLYDPYADKYEILKNYCQYIVDPGVCITNGRRMHYPGTFWWPTDTAFFSQLYPNWFTDEHNVW